MRKVFAHFNQPPCPVEKNDGISLTEPEQSMTIEEIIESFLNGVTIEPDADASFDGDDDLDPGIVDVYDDVLDAIDHAPENEFEKDPGKSSQEKDPGKSSQEKDPGKSSQEKDPGKSSQEKDPGKSSQEKDPG